MCWPLVAGGECGLRGGWRTRLPGGLRASRGAVADVGGEVGDGGSSGRSMATAESVGAGDISVAGGFGSSGLTDEALAAPVVAVSRGALADGPRATDMPITTRPASIPN